MAGERSWEHITRPAGHLAHPTDRPPSTGQPPTPISSTPRCHIPSSSKHSPLASITSHLKSIPSQGPTIPTLPLGASLPQVPTAGREIPPNNPDSTPPKVAPCVGPAINGFGLSSSNYSEPESESTVGRNRLRGTNHPPRVSAAMKSPVSASCRSQRRLVDYENQPSTSPPSFNFNRRRHFVAVNASRPPTTVCDVSQCPGDGDVCDVSQCPCHGDACGTSRCSCRDDNANQTEAQTTSPLPLNNPSVDREHECCVTSVATSSTVSDTSPAQVVSPIQGSAMMGIHRLEGLSRILPAPDVGYDRPESPTCPPRHSRSRDEQSQSQNLSSNLPSVTPNILRPYYCVNLNRDNLDSDSIAEEAESLNAFKFGFPTTPFSSSLIPGSGSSPWRIPISVPLLLLCFVFTILAPAAVRADQVVLLDTTQESSLKWTRYPFGPNSPTPGWIEESFTRFEEGINWRSYVVCDVNYPSVNNWLWTPFIERGPANRMYVEIKFSMRDCSLFPGTALSCKETFSLLYYEFDAATKEPPFWESESYKLIDRIAADDGRFTNNNEVIINTEVRSIPVTKKGVYFALRDQGACISLLSIKVYYLTCPEITSSFAHFPTTPTGAEVTSIEQSTGTCVGHARSDRDPIYLCTGDGKWSLLSGGCVCLPGYQANAEKQTCDVCPPGQFKHQAGSLECSGCPEHSAAPHAGSTECRCDTGYYRATDDPKDMPCTRPPGKPRNLTASVVDQSTVELSWQPPLQHGGRHDTTYRIVCDACSSHVTFVPPQVAEESFNTTEVKVRGLSALSSYRFQVIAENGVSKQAPQQSSAGITVTTEAAGGFRVLPSDNKGPSMVRNVRITSVKSTEISLGWQPSLDPFSEIEMYEVRYYVKSQETNSSSILTTKEECTLGDLKQGTIYGFQVREKTTAGWGQYSPALYKMTGQMLGTAPDPISLPPAYVGEDDNTHVRIIVGATIGSFVLLGLVVAVVLLVLRSRGSDDCSKKQPSDCDTLEYRNGEVHGVLENPPIVQTHTAGSMTTPLFTPVGHHRTYIDPHTYEDPNQAIREFAREIDASYITIEAIIGGGEFGDVCKGKLTLPKRPEMTVAIKTLKTGSSEKARVDFLTEASIMGQFEHPNVIFLQGVVTRSNPVMIITEYMENGSLDHFLRVNDGKFQVLQLVGMLRCIASGMQYLSEMNYVHRDLAARNVLVNAQLVCKIADFGLSREIESHTEAAYTTRGGKIPVRWTAPEAIAFRKFTSASDVWSLGIVMWEVMSYGERPYWNWSNQDVIKSIEKGYRLPAPMECPEAIYQLMLDCWQKERNHRPNFASIVHTLDSLIRTPEALAKVAQNRCQTALGLDSTDLTQLGSVEEWLASLKMSRYLENFEGAGLTEMQAVARLNQRDLTTLGIALVGHQKKILQSIQTLRTQYAVNMSEGFLV